MLKFIYRRYEVQTRNRFTVKTLHEYLKLIKNESLRNYADLSEVQMIPILLLDKFEMLNDYNKY